GRRRDRPDSDSDGGEPPLRRPGRAGFIAWSLAMVLALVCILIFGIVHSYEPIRGVLDIKSLLAKYVASTKGDFIAPIQAVPISQRPYQIERSGVVMFEG